MDAARSCYRIDIGGSRDHSVENRLLSQKKKQIEGDKMKNKNEKILFYAIIVAAAAIVAVSAFMFISSRYGANYQKAMSAQNPNDICATPSGYTDQQWREHMSHHPDMYVGCLT